MTIWSVPTWCGLLVLLVMQKAWCFHPRKFVRSNGVSTGATSQYLQPIVPDLKNVAFKIKDVIPSERIDSVRLRHIQVETKELAEDCKRLLSEGLTDFASLASSLSTCSHSKGRGGDLGWHFLHVEKEATSDTHSIPLELKNAAIFMSKGDITVVSSDFEAPLESVPSKLVSVSKRWHVLQLLDATTVLTPTLMKRRRDSFAQSKVKASPSTPNLPEAISPTYSIETMGCQMNMADSERMEAQLVDLGYSRTHNNSVANVVIINTCSIRDHAEQKVYSYLGPHVARKRRGEDVSIMVAGCVAQQEGQKILRRFPEIDAVMGPQYANKVGDILQSVFEGHQLVATDPAIQSEDRVPALRKSDIAAYVNVIYGCNERCTYCVVPNTRGIEQSRTKDAIIAEIGDLVAHGYQEITLLGQNIDSWGRDMTPKQRFADLLIAVAQVPGLRRVRFLTSHPKYMSRRVVEAVAANKVLTPCFNVPFQSGNDEILRLMRRGYTRSRYLEIVQSIRSLVPDAAITADCIVGFPGETEEQFQDTLSLMEEVQFEQVNTAAYSPRPGTPAADWPNQLSDEIKQDRLQRINRLGTIHALKRSERFVGRVQDVLVEDINPRNLSQVIGRNPHSRQVYFEGNFAALRGQMVPVRIIEARPYSLVGVLVD